MSTYGKVIKINKTCDQCRQRKVRCIVPPPKPHTRPIELPLTCVNCVNRGEPCNYSIFRRKRVALPPGLGKKGPEPSDGELYIDRILQRGPQEVVLFEDAAMFKVPDNRVKTCAMAFFSNQRVASLAERLGPECLTDIVERLEGLVQKRINGRGEAELEEYASSARISFHNPLAPETVQPAIAKAFIKAYFDHIHPVYPFLDEEEFCSIALSSALDDDYLKRNPVFSCLYHTVLALGSQYFHGGGFVPRLGQAWGLFQISLGLIPCVLAPPHSVTNLQALAAMSIFSLNPCCVQLELTIISEVARMAHTLQYHTTANSPVGHLKAFWVVYYIDKLSNFTESVSSLLADEDIGCIIPPAPESLFDDYNWYISAIRFGRLCSVAYSALFSVSASLKSKEGLRSAIPNIMRMLENWRLSVPLKFRPQEPIQIQQDATPSTKRVFLETQYHYLNLLIAIDRLSLQVEAEGSPEREKVKFRLMRSARTVIELTHLVELDGILNIFLCGMMPIAALFILFDFVVHNPRHRDTQENLILLDTAAAHFRLIDAASHGIIPGNTIAEFAGIARKYATTSIQATSVSRAREPPVGNPSATSVPQIAPLPMSNDFGLTKLQLTAVNSNSTQESQTAEYLNYPTTDTMLEADTSLGDLKSLFGWVFPDWGDMSIT
ncbi:hypothetical protein B0T14DRAFT_234895 [Immersiella caudata]|uniref:Zn(2)-C6 fungal-type domain-containing protein n=1 Tax=Immersiella caudata TaxID=314043 RepID=A0AA39WS70_9PEZI|nr:hypothetical protein B0T14DRAFT_234895 [Immersiella caudata]